MNNLYRKVAATSFSIALGFTLGANKEAEAATFILTDPEVFSSKGTLSIGKPVVFMIT